MEEIAYYPYVLKDVFEANQFENIVDSNILTPYIPDHVSIPRIEDPRKTQVSSTGEPRYPGYVKSAQINQIFNYIGFIKRMNKQEYAIFLPVLFQELNRFIRVIEEIVYAPTISISADILAEMNQGLQNFFEAYHNRRRNKAYWIEEIWKYQKIYLEHIDIFLQTLELNGQVFDLKADPLYDEIAGFCRQYFHNQKWDPPSATDINFVANCCTKAAHDDEPKTIWSGDQHITRILWALYHRSSIVNAFPQIYLRASYLPLRFNQLFPPEETEAEEA